MARKRYVAVAVVLALHVVLLARIGWKDSPNRTEVGHMAAGLYTWNTFRFDVFHTNPPFVRAVATAPVAFCHPRCRAVSSVTSPQERPEWALGSAFVRLNEARTVRWYFAIARWTCIPFAMFGAVVCYLFARELYGDAAGYCALILWCLSPMILAWGATICPDVAAASFGLAAIYTLRRWLRAPCWNRAMLAGLTLGLAQLTKFTLLVLYPLVPLLWLLDRLAARPRICGRQWFHELLQLAVTVCLSLLLINIGYGFAGSCQPLGDFRFHTTLFSGHRSLEELPAKGANPVAGTWLGDLPIPLPANFVQGIDTQRLDFERGMPSYIRGQWAEHGWWYYYLYALAIKMPLGIWALVLLAISAAIFERGYPASRPDEIVVLATFLVIFTFVSSQTGFSVHSRYILPALPFLFVWASRAARALERRPVTQGQLALAALVVLAMTWTVGSSLAIYPHCMSYFNELAGPLPANAIESCAANPGQIDSHGADHGTNGWSLNRGPRSGPQHLLGSNCDWGQDLCHLKDWLDSHPGVKLDGLVYRGGYPATFAGIPETPRPPPLLGRKHGDHNLRLQNEVIGSSNEVRPTSNWYALSVNEIYGHSQQYCYYRSLKPTAMAGYSIYIYRVDSNITE